MFLRIEFPDPTGNPSYDLFDVPHEVVHCNILSEMDDEAIDRQRAFYEREGLEVFTRSMWPANSVKSQITMVEIIIPGSQPKVIMTNYHATLVRDGGVPMEALFRYRPAANVSPTNECAASSAEPVTRKVRKQRKPRAEKTVTRKRRAPKGSPRKTAKRRAPKR